VTLAHLVGRKRQGDVIRALWILRDRHPRLRHLIVGDGPERPQLEGLAQQLGLADRVDFAGQLANPEALQATWAGHLFVLPSVDEAFGVAYVEAMAGGFPRSPASGSRARGDRGGRARDPARGSRRHPGAGGSHRAASCRARRASSANAPRGRARPSSAPSPGSGAGARRCACTSGRWT
jgi:hypothetical protein